MTVRIETVPVTLHVEAHDRVTRDEILSDLRPQLEAMQEQHPRRQPGGGALWWLNSHSAVIIAAPGAEGQLSGEALFRRIAGALAGIIPPELAAATAEVLTRADAYDALDYVKSVPEGGPDCSCGGDHWSCDYDPDAEDDASDD